MSASTCRSSPAASSRCTGRSGGRAGRGVAGPPIGEPSSSCCSRSRCASSMRASRSAISAPVSRRPSTVAWPGYQGRPLAASAATRTAVSPHTSARSRRSSTAAVTAVFGRAVADQRDQLGQRHGGGLGVQHQQGVEHREPQKVQLVGGGLDRLAGLRARRQRRDAAGWRLGQVGPQLQQPDQPLVGQVGQPGAQRDARSVFGHC